MTTSNEPSKSWAPPEGMTITKNYNNKGLFAPPGKAYLKGRYTYKGVKSELILTISTIDLTPEGELELKQKLAAELEEYSQLKYKNLQQLFKGQ